MTGEDWTQARKVRWEMTDEDRARFFQLFQGEWICEPTEPLDLSPQKECTPIPCTLNEP